jgi:hypothetical protein
LWFAHKDILVPFIFMILIYKLRPLDLALHQTIIFAIFDPIEMVVPTTDIHIREHV